MNLSFEYTFAHNIYGVYTQYKLNKCMNLYGTFSKCLVLASLSLFIHYLINLSSTSPFFPEFSGELESISVVSRWEGGLEEGGGPDSITGPHIETTLSGTRS